jgi:hypothetical protein
LWVAAVSVVIDCVFLFVSDGISTTVIEMPTC